MKISKNYTIDPAQPLLQGHFPGRPIVPGVMLLRLVKAALSEALARPCRMRSIVRHKFVKPVLPGFMLRIDCELDDGDLAGPCQVTCRIVDQDGDTVANGTYRIEFLP